MQNKDYEIINSNNREYWINQNFVSKNLKNDLKNVDVLIIPDFRGENKEMGFYEESFHFYEFLQDESENMDIMFCCDEESFSVFRLQSAEIWMGTFIVTNIVLPLFLSLLGDYLYDHLFHDPDDDIDIEISVENKKNTKTLKYHGNYDNFLKLIKNKSDFMKLFDENE